MTLESILETISGKHPDFTPFMPYVIGLPGGPDDISLGDPILDAAAYIYVNNLLTAHNLVQEHENDPVGAYIHGIIHRREGDFSNANYWFRRSKLELNLDPEKLTNQVEMDRNISTELHQDLLEEWKSVVRHILKKT